MRFTTYEIYGDKGVENNLDIEGYFCPLNTVCQYSGNKNASSCLFVISANDAEKFEMPSIFTYDYCMCFPDYVLIQLESVVINDPEKMTKIDIEGLNKLLDVSHCYAEKWIPKGNFDLNDVLFDEPSTSELPPPEGGGFLAYGVKPEDLYDFEYYKLIKICNNGNVMAINVYDSVIELGQYEIEKFAEESFESYSRGLSHLKITKDEEVVKKYNSKVNSIINYTE